MPDLVYNYDGYVLRSAQENDLPALLEFQKSFHVYEESEGSEIFFYHIEDDPFSKSDFEKIISRQEIVISQKDDEIVAYTLIDNCSTTKSLQDHLRYISHFLKEEYLDPDSRMAPRLAELVNPAYKREKLTHYMFSMVVHIARDKYNALFCCIPMRQVELMEKLKQGWKIVFENGMYCFMHWDYNTEKMYEQE